MVHVNQRFFLMVVHPLFVKIKIYTLVCTPCHGCRASWLFLINNFENIIAIGKVRNVCVEWDTRRIVDTEDQ